MTVLADIWDGIPGEVKIILAISIFLFAGSTLLQVLVILWNLIGVNGMNAVNGCWTGTPANCIPEQEGIFIFGINFADYWTIVFIIFFVFLIEFAFKWYSLTLRK